MSLIGIRSSNRSVVTVRASRGRPVTEADTDSSRDKRSDIPPANASGRMRAGQTNEKVIHRNTIIIIIDARRPTWNNDRENIISPRDAATNSCSRGTGMEDLSRASRRVCLHFHISFYFLVETNEPTGLAMGILRW